jgi:hypothetical protein
MSDVEKMRHITDVRLTWYEALNKSKNETLPQPSTVSTDRCCAEVGNCASEEIEISHEISIKFHVNFISKVEVALH